MRLEKSSFGYTLVSNKETNEKAEDNLDSPPKNHISFMTELITRLRNLFLSVIPSNYCCIILSDEDKLKEETSKVECVQESVIVKTLKYKEQKIALIKYQLTEELSEDDNVKVDMLLDLFGYLLYYHLLILEFLSGDQP